jgi:hypothetical protein
VSEQSVDEVLGFGDGIAALGVDGAPTEEEAYKLTKQVRRQMGEENRR